MINEPFSTAAMLLIPSVTTSKGSTKKTFPTVGDIFFCSFKTFGGTEKVVNDTLVIENTAKVKTWYRPDIKADCRIKLENGATYEVIGEPENISMRNQYLYFTVRQVKGGA